MLPLNLFLVLAITTFSSAVPLPSPKVTLSHTSSTTGETSSSVIDPSLFSSKFAKALNGSDINIHITSAQSKEKRGSTLRRLVSVIPRLRSLTTRATIPSSSSPASGINNSTINLTVISKRREQIMAMRAAGATDVPLVDLEAPSKRQAHIAARRAAINALRASSALLHSPATTKKRAAILASRAEANETETSTHHNVYIDASSAAAGTGGGIHNSTININVISSRSPKTVVGDHSVLLNPEGIEDSTVHVNILPGRAVNKSVGDHSILIDSSSLSSDEGETNAGDHSAVVSSHINSSTINLTVVKAKEAPIASGLEMLEKRDLTQWEEKVNSRSLALDNERTEQLFVPSHTASHASRARSVVDLSA
ncbi:hypothetical protein P7C70_g692, partial [Phenoliferia sp. Uapishka_3]